MLLLLGLISMLAACGGGEETGADAEGDGELKDTYTVASDTSFVPFEFKEDGEYVGFDIDLINAVADEAGFEIELETTNFDGIIPGLQTGSFDMAVAGIGITEERKKKIDYSDPYFESGLAIGVPKTMILSKALKILKARRLQPGLVQQVPRI